MQKLFFKRLQRQIQIVDSELSREKSIMGKKWLAMKKQLQAPTTIYIFLLSGVVTGYSLVPKRQPSDSPSAPSKNISPDTFSPLKMLELTTTLAALFVQLISYTTDSDSVTPSL